MNTGERIPGAEARNFDETLADIRRPGGSRAEAIWGLLHSCRQHLLALAERKTEPELRRVVGPSDLVSEALLDAHGHIDKFRGQTEGQFRRWLGMILRTRLTRARRRLGSRPPLGLDDSRMSFFDPGLIAPDTPPSEFARRSEDAHRLRCALAELPEHYRRVIQLHFVEGRTEPELAILLDVTEAAAHGYVLRAVRKLRIALASQR
jgi:RNA polymerase sigma-70 factor (ECF subfamily)